MQANNTAEVFANTGVPANHLNAAKDASTPARDVTYNSQGEVISAEPKYATLIKDNAVLNESAQSSLNTIEEQVKEMYNAAEHRTAAAGDKIENQVGEAYRAAEHEAEVVGNKIGDIHRAAERNVTPIDKTQVIAEDTKAELDKGVLGIAATPDPYAHSLKEDAIEIAGETKQLMKNKLGEFTHTAEDVLADLSRKTTDKYAEFKQDASVKAEESKHIAYEKLDELAHKTEAVARDLLIKTDEAFERLKVEATKRVDEGKHIADAAKNELGVKMGELSHRASDAAHVRAEEGKQLVSLAGDQASSLIHAAKDKSIEAFDYVLNKSGELLDKEKDIISAKVSSTKNTLKDGVLATRQLAKSSMEVTKEAMKESVGDAKGAIYKTVEKLEDAGISAAGVVKEAAVDMYHKVESQSIKEETHTLYGTLKGYVSGLFSKGEATHKETVSTSIHDDDVNNAWREAVMSDYVSGGGGGGSNDIDDTRGAVAAVVERKAEPEGERVVVHHHHTTELLDNSSFEGVTPLHQITHSVEYVTDLDDDDDNEEDNGADIVLRGADITPW